MSVEAVVAVLGCLLLVAMAYLVGRLQGEVRRLSGELRAQAPPAADPLPIAVPVSLTVPAPRAESIDVPVITGLATSADEPDFSVSRVASVTLARPLIKVAAFSYGLRRALDDERRFRIRYAMRLELKRQRKMRRRRRAGRAPSKRWES